MKRIFAVILSLFFISPVFAQDCNFKMEHRGNPVADFTKSYFRSWGCLFQKKETWQSLEQATNYIARNNCNHFVVLPNGAIANTGECVNGQFTTIDNNQYNNFQDQQIRNNTLRLQQEQLEYYQKMNRLNRNKY